MGLRVSSLATRRTREEQDRDVWVGTVEVDGCVEWRGGSRAVRSRAAMISHVKPNAVPTHRHIQTYIHAYSSTRGQMDLADPSHPSSNPLILEMSRSAVCEATGQWAPIRKMAGFDASRGTGDRKSKENGTTLYHTTVPMPTQPTVWPARTWVPGAGTNRPVDLGQDPPAHHCWGDLDPCQSRSLARRLLWG